MSATAAFALALLRLDGVGRVTAHRLLAAAPTYDDLRTYPQEQILVRLKGTPNAEAIVRRLLDADAMQTGLAEAERALGVLASRHVRVWTARDDGWPRGLDALARNERPVVLYTYGVSSLLTQPTVAFMAHLPLPDAPFEAAQDLMRDLIAARVPLVGGAAHGFDVVLHKLCYEARHPSLAVVGSGMAQMERSFRPTASAVVGAGGLVASPFDMHHGPFPHDDTERALVQAALAAAVVVVHAPPDSPEATAAERLRAAGRPVFSIAEGITAAEILAVLARQ